MLGDNVKLIPEFKLAPSQQSELADAYAVSKSGALLDFLKSTKQIEDTVDDWLHGVARVREKLFAWEQMTTLGAILSDAELPLTPLQLPHRGGESWLALEFDATKKPDGERLLYTAYFSTELDTSSPICGLLLDREWTEVMQTARRLPALSFTMTVQARSPRNVGFW